MIEKIPSTERIKYGEDTKFCHVHSSPIVMHPLHLLQPLHALLLVSGPRYILSLRTVTSPSFWIVLQVETTDLRVAPSQAYFLISG